MAVMKTPGVYIVEKNAFPNSVVEVATAVPAFIGYTEFARNGGTDLTRKPWRISTMAEYERYFGQAPRARFTIKVVDPKLVSELQALEERDTTARQTHAAEITKLLAAPQSALGEARTALDTAKSAHDGKPADQSLLDTLKEKRAAHDLAEAALTAAKKRATPAAALAAILRGKLDVLAGAEGKLSAAQLATPAQTPAPGQPAPPLSPEQLAVDGARTAVTDAEKALAEAVAEGNRLSLARSAIERLPVHPNDTEARGQHVAYKHGDRQYLLSREAGAAGGRYLMHQAMRHFFQNGGGPCYVVSVGDYGTEDQPVEIEAGDSKAGLLSGLAPLLKEQEPTMVVVPDAVLLRRSDCVLVQTEVLKHCGYEMKSRVAILDVWGGERDAQDEAGPCIENFRNDIGINFLDYAAAYYPWLETSLVQGRDLTYDIFANPEELAALLRQEAGLDEVSAAVADTNTKMILGALDDIANDDKAWEVKLHDDIASSTKSDDEKKKAKAQMSDPTLLKVAVKTNRELLHKTLLRMGKLFSNLMDEAQRQVNLMPPSAAMAGLYTMVDNTRGVWKAPANVSVAGVIKPAVEISHYDQEDLNVTPQGKSINAIRSFIGEGALVWGARTLDGNSLDWRYINVRRTMIMLEESCRLAAKAMVFEPNVANTWVTIKSMISNFLTGIWKRGGLAGAVPEDAFSVHVGLGETMTPEDILEGILRVTVLVAISRPAEFIEITFQQQMQKS